jgi:hypothetical protein
VAYGQRQRTTTSGDCGIVEEAGLLVEMGTGVDGLVDIDGRDRSEFDRRTSSHGKLGYEVDSGVLTADDASIGEEQSIDSMSVTTLMR